MSDPECELGEVISDAALLREEITRLRAEVAAQAGLIGTLQQEWQDLSAKVERLKTQGRDATDLRYAIERCLKAERERDEALAQVEVAKLSVNVAQELMARIGISQPLLDRLPIAPPPIGASRKCLLCAYEKPWAIWDQFTTATICEDCRNLPAEARALLDRLQRAETVVKAGLRYKREVERNSQTGADHPILSLCTHDHRGTQNEYDASEEDFFMALTEWEGFN